MPIGDQSWEIVVTVRKVQPQALFQRSLDGRVLYSHVVVAEAKSLIFISGQLARDKSGQIVAPGNSSWARRCRRAPLSK
jgi:enamine deaminase RidA (YjgF/YER057c/UK114 family)